MKIVYDNRLSLEVLDDPENWDGVYSSENISFRFSISLSSNEKGVAELYVTLFCNEFDSDAFYNAWHKFEEFARNYKSRYYKYVDKARVGEFGMRFDAETKLDDIFRELETLFEQVLLCYEAELDG